MILKLRVFKAMKVITDLENGSAEPEITVGNF